jgi:RNA-directed DNA polymerase
MKRWDLTSMLDIGRKLFAKIHKQKHQAHHNHDIHFLARELNDWLVEGIHALIDGSYTPRFLKRCYFPDEMIDQLHLSDRILQHVLLHQLKPTFPFVMNPNCYHLHGPSGVKYATEQVKKVLEEMRPKYLIRADIKSYYKSISHHQLVKDIQAHYHDPKLNLMLERIIVNPIETPRGYKNPDTGIALRGPLSQFFSGLYLKPLDDAFNEMDVAYFRYQDDILILCQSMRSLNRCKQRLMQVLQERRLRLSGKKTRIGSIDKGFHFLGIQYPKTQPLDNTTMTQAVVNVSNTEQVEQNLSKTGGDNLATRKAASFANAHCSSCKNIAQSARAS